MKNGLQIVHKLVKFCYARRPPLGRALPRSGVPATHAVVLYCADVACGRLLAHCAPPSGRAQQGHGQAGGSARQGALPVL